MTLLPSFECMFDFSLFNFPHDLVCIAIVLLILSLIALLSSSLVSFYGSVRPKHAAPRLQQAVKKGVGVVNEVSLSAVAGEEGVRIEQENQVASVTELTKLCRQTF